MGENERGDWTSERKCEDSSGSCNSITKEDIEKNSDILYKIAENGNLQNFSENCDFRKKPVFYYIFAIMADSPSANISYYDFIVKTEENVTNIAENVFYEAFIDISRSQVFKFTQ